MATSSGEMSARRPAQARAMAEARTERNSQVLQPGRVSAHSGLVVTMVRNSS